MATYQLPPPEPLCLKGDMVENVKSFKSRWLHWKLATGLNSKLTKEDGSADPNGKKLVAATLLTIIGREAERISRTKPEFTATVLDDPEMLWEAFEKHFLPERHVLFERFKFFKCEQTVAEKTTDYEIRLRSYAASCEFGELEDELLRDILVAHTTDTSTRDKLLKERPVPNLKRCLEVLTAAETSRNFTDQLSLSEAQIHATKRQPTHSTTQKNLSKDKPYYSSCKFCGKAHFKGECPAFGKKCHECGGMNHLSVVCKSKRNQQPPKSKKTHTVTYYEESSDEDAPIEPMQKSHSLKRINEIKKGKDGQFMVKMTYLNHYGNYNMATQLDTGATCNAMSYDDLIQICQCVPTLGKPKGSIQMYDGSITKPLGTYTLDVHAKGDEGKKQRIMFDIIPKAPWPIISGKICQMNDWITLNIGNHIHQTQPDIKDIQEPLTKDAVLSTYNDSFNGLGCLAGDYRIEIDETVRPCQDAPRRVPIALKDKIQDRIDELVSQNIIEKVEGHSDWISSAVYVEKNNKIRVTLDPKALNKAILRPRYQMPTIDEVLPKLNNAKVFSVLDAKDGFFQILLSPESQKLTTFWGPNGTKYMYLRCPQGICSAPEEYQRRQVEALNGLTGCHVIADDIIVFGSGDTLLEASQDHDNNFKALMERASKVNLKFNKSKLRFKLHQVSYMGHLLTDEGVKPDPLKIDAICLMPKPSTSKAVLRLLGSINYLAKFLPKLSTIVEPLRRLTRQDIPFHWESEQEEAYQTILKLITSTPVLKYYNVKEEITLENDCSSKGIGCCLKQNDQPVAFASRALTATEQNYAQIEKEMLAIVFGCERFHQYIYGRDIINIETDHKPLVTIFKKPIHSAPKRLQRMMLRLDKFNIDLKHKKGSEMYLSDMLSRAFLPNYEKKDADIPQCYVFQLAEEQEVFDTIAETKQADYMNITGTSEQQIKEASQCDHVLQSLARVILHGWPETKNELPLQIRQFWSFRDELIVQNGIIYKGMKIFIPQALRKLMINKVHSSHLGRDRCIRRAKDVLYWPGLTTDIANAVEQCEICALYSVQQQKEPMMSHPIPTLPFEIVSQDLFSHKKGNYLLTVDHYSDYFMVDNLDNDTTASNVIEHTKDHFADHGTPEAVITDNGPQFTSQEYQDFSREWDFTHKTSSPLYPQSNGKAEITVKTAKSLLKKAKEDGKDFKQSLLDWRNAPGPDGFSPAQKLLSKRTKTTIPCTKGSLAPKIVEGVPDMIKRRKQRSKEHYDQTAKTRPELQIGEHVRIQPSIPKQPWSAGSISSKVGPRSFIVQHENGKSYRRNEKWLKPDKSIRSQPPNVQEDDDTYIAPQENPTAPIIEESESNQATNTSPLNPIDSTDTPYVTRSGRSVRKPSRFIDA